MQYRVKNKKVVANFNVLKLAKLIIFRLLCHAKSAKSSYLIFYYSLSLCLRHLKTFYI